MPPASCVKCGSSKFKEEKLSMYGKFGYGGKGYLFTAYICSACGYTELYFDKSTGLI
ncbi:MAG: zinc ribbon domain-containing protein [Conexivisphaerales archaeon]